MKGQRKFSTSGTSYLSLADAGLGAAAGFLVPVVANKFMESWTTKPTFVADNQSMVAAAIGVAVAIPVYYWRGLAPAIIAAAMALVYGIGPQITTWVNELGQSGFGGAQMGSGRAVGLLQQASRQRNAVGALQSVPRRRSREFAGHSD
ncbi:MAG: hypothetical protein M0R22_00195 [Dehalococcoidia bacterium]|jgi:hypothetical protein|nr:hypothetical protein [Dehalococcoidia bacterium]